MIFHKEKHFALRSRKNEFFWLFSQIELVTMVLNRRALNVHQEIDKFKEHDR